MKALPSRFAETWRKAKCDKTGKVEFLIRPLNNFLRSHIAGLGWYSDGENIRFSGGSSSFDSVAYVLKDIRGLENPEDGSVFQLEFDEVTIGSKVYQKLTYDCLNRLPVELYEELTRVVTESTAITQKESDDLGNTQSSATQSSKNAETATETKTDAPSDPSPESS